MDEEILEEIDEIRLHVGVSRSALIREVLMDAREEFERYALKALGKNLEPRGRKSRGLHFPGVLLVERVKSPMRGYTHPGPERDGLFRRILDEIPTYTLNMHFEAYNEPSRFSLKALARRVGLNVPLLRSWLYSIKDYRVGWFQKGWILNGNTCNGRMKAVFKAASTDDIMKDWFSQDLHDIRPLRSRDDFRWHIMEYLRRNGPSTLNEVYDGVILKDPYGRAGMSRFARKRSFNSLINGMRGVTVVDKSRGMNVYALEEGR